MLRRLFRKLLGRRPAAPDLLDLLVFALRVGQWHRAAYMADGRWWLYEWTGAEFALVDRFVLRATAERVAREREGRAAETVVAEGAD